MKNRNIIHWIWLGLVICLLGAAPAQAFYNPQQGRWINRDPIEERGGNNLYLCTSNNLICNIDAYGLMALDSVTAAIENCLRSPPPVAVECLQQLLSTVADEAQANLIRNALNDLKSKLLGCSLMHTSYSNLCKREGCNEDWLGAAEYVKRALEATSCAMLRAQWLRKCACKGFMGGTADSEFYKNHWIEVGKATAKALTCWHKAKLAGWGGQIPTINP